MWFLNLYTGETKATSPQTHNVTQDSTHVASKRIPKDFKHV